MSATFSRAISMMTPFDHLWNLHPKSWTGTANNGPNPCSREAVFPHQCAIRLSTTLRRAGIDLSSTPGGEVPIGCKPHQIDKPDGSTAPGHFIRAYELRDWLAAHPDFPPVIKTGPRQPREFWGKQGIVCWVGFWGDNNNRGHIDLWNGKAPKGRRIPFPGVRGEKMFTDSRFVWFWWIA